MTKVTPIKGNLVAIELKSLEIAEFSGEDNELKFSNPRHFKPGRPGIDGEGFDRISMDELRTAIRDEGLLEPLIIRSTKKDGKLIYQVIAGERRFRSCKKLHDDDEPCLNPATGEIEPGSKVYNQIECRLFENLSDRDAMKLAFIENETSVGIGDAANFKLFRYWRNSGLTDDEILEITKKGPAWIRHMDQISTLDDKCVDAYLSGEINQTVALKLAQAPEEDRLKLLVKACEFANKRVENVLKAAQEEYNLARDNQQIAKVGVVVAEHENVNVEEAKKEAAKAEKKLLEKKKKLDEIKENQKPAGRKDLVKAAVAITGRNPQNINTAMRGPAIQKHVLDVLDRLIKNDGFEDEEQISDVPTLEIIRLVAQAISDGEIGEGQDKKSLITLLLEN